MRIAFAALLVATAAGFTMSCGRQPAGTVDPRTSSFVEVRNESFYDMTIYIVRGTARFRLGTVGGNSTQVFEIPRTYVNPGLPIRFMADPIGSRVTPHSDEIPVWPGDTIVLRIPPAEVS